MSIFKTVLSAETSIDGNHFRFSASVLVLDTSGCRRVDVVIVVLIDVVISSVVSLPGAGAVWPVSDPIQSQVDGSDHASQTCPSLGQTDMMFFTQRQKEAHEEHLLNSQEGPNNEEFDRDDKVSQDQKQNKQTTSCFYLMLNLQEGSDNIEFLITKFFKVC